MAYQLFEICLCWLWSVLKFPAAGFRFRSAWDQVARWAPPAATHIPRVGIEGSSPGGIKSGWVHGAMTEQRAKLCMCVC